MSIIPTVTHARNLPKYGFTIVELLVVIVVIAILAVITIVAYNGIQHRATNASVLTEFGKWKQAFSLYYVNSGAYPNMPDGNYCLGTGFPGGKCRDYLANNANTYTEAASTSLMTQLATVVQIPPGPKYPINGTVGPYVTYRLGSGGYFVGMTIVLWGGSGDCPVQTYYVWDDGAGRLLCEYDFPLNGSGS